jgi:[ribosomal protein S5]-alanine N-acetyltransferase
MKILETERLILRELSTEDAPFILQLLNEPSFLRFIGDKGVRTLDDARQYILNGPLKSYEKHGYGLYCVELKQAGTSIGISGLVRRETLSDTDIGFAFLPAYWSQGFALESAAAVMRHARENLGLGRILAITSPDNESSARLLSKLGLRFDRMIKLADDAEEIRLFTTDP